MQFKKLTPDLFVSGQIVPTDVAEIAKQGFKSVLCNRPDGEREGQPTFDEIKHAAGGSGVRFFHLPVNPKAISDDDALVFAGVFSKMPKPALAYCGTGTRATTLWALSQMGKMPAAEILEIARQAGYDLAAVTPRLQGRA